MKSIYDYSQSERSRGRDLAPEMSPLWGLWGLWVFHHSSMAKSVNVPPEVPDSSRQFQTVPDRSQTNFREARRISRSGLFFSDGSLVYTCHNFQWYLSRELVLKLMSSKTFAPGRIWTHVRQVHENISPALYQLSYQGLTNTKQIKCYMCLMWVCFQVHFYIIRA